VVPICGNIIIFCVFDLCVILLDVGRPLGFLPSSVLVLVTLIEKLIYNVDLNSDIGDGMFKNNDCNSCFQDAQNMASSKTLDGSGNFLILKVGGGRNK